MLKEQKKIPKLHSLRRRFIFKAMESREFHKTLSFALFIKTVILPHNYINNYSVTKLRKITHCGVDTIKKYVPLCVKYGFAEFETRKDGTKNLVFKRLSSGTKNRNTNIEKLEFNSFVDAYKQIRSLFPTTVCAQKIFTKGLMQKASKPKNWLKRGVRDNFRAAKQACKKFGWQEFNGGFTYKENGFSYKGMARKFGCCARTAFNIVKYAVKHHFIIKHRRFEWTWMPGVGRQFVPGYTFTTDNFGCKVQANVYDLTPQWRKALVDLTPFEIPLTEDEYDEIIKQREEHKAKWQTINRWRWIHSKAGKFIMSCLDKMNLSDDVIDKIMCHRCPTNKEVFGECPEGKMNPSLLAWL
jgi:hypothetical protein